MHAFTCAVHVCTANGICHSQQTDPNSMLPRSWWIPQVKAFNLLQIRIRYTTHRAQASQDCYQGHIACRNFESHLKDEQGCMSMRKVLACTLLHTEWGSECSWQLVHVFTSHAALGLHQRETHDVQSIVWENFVHCIGLVDTTYQACINLSRAMH